jgi:beta-fructofuranosidase
VIDVDGLYHMFYCGGGEDLIAYEINLATSTDLYHWKRWPEGPLFRDGYEARDPFVIRIGDQWVM